MIEYDKEQELRDKCDEPDFHDQVLIAREDLVIQLSGYIYAKTRLLDRTINPLSWDELSADIVDWFVDENLISQRFSK